MSEHDMIVMNWLRRRCIVVALCLSNVNEELNELEVDMRSPYRHTRQYQLCDRGELEGGDAAVTSLFASGYSQHFSLLCSAIPYSGRLPHTAQVESRGVGHLPQRTARVP
jgi:hypothetical protein